MDNITDLPHLLAKASVTVPADTVPADPTGKGKQVVQEKIQPRVKLSSDSKSSLGMEDIDIDEDDDGLIPTPAKLTGKSDPSSSKPPTWTDDIYSSSEDDDELGEVYRSFRFDRRLPRSMTDSALLEESLFFHPRFPIPRGNAFFDEDDQEY